MGVGMKGQLSKEQKHRRCSHCGIMLNDVEYRGVLRVMCTICRSYSGYSDQTKFVERKGKYT